MASRLASRGLLRYSIGRHLKPLAPRFYSDCVPAIQVPVVSYHHGERTMSEIQCHKPETPCGHDDKREAHCLKAQVLSSLTPTLKKFTMAGKVAVVTG